MKKLILLFLFCAPSAWAQCTNTVLGGAVTCIQSVQAGGSVSSQNATFTSNNTAGNFIVAGVVGNSDPTHAPVFSVTDSVGDTFASAIAIGTTGGGSYIQVFFVQSCIGGANTITVTSSNANAFTYINIMAGEFSGIANTFSEDTNTAQASGSSAAPASGNYTVTNADLIIGLGLSSSIVNGAGFNSLGTDTFDMLEAQVISGTTANAVYTSANTAWIVQGVAFHAAITFNSFTSSDTTNTASSAWSPALVAGDLLVGYAGTQLTGGQISGPFLNSPSSAWVTMSDGTVVTPCVLTGCDFSGVSSLDTKLGTGTTMAGTPTIAFNTTMAGQTIGGVGIDISGVNTVDQISSNGFTSVALMATITSNSITTTHNNEMILCLANEANPIAGGNHIAFGISSGWTAVAFGNQGIAYQAAAVPGTYSCTMTMENGVPSSTTEDIAMTIVSFYKASGAPPVDSESPTVIIVRK